MEPNQNSRSKKGKNKGKRNIITSPEKLEKILSFRSSKPAASPEGSRRGAAKIKSSQPEPKPAQPQIAMGDSEKEAMFLPGGLGRGRKRTMGLMQLLLPSQRSSRFETGDGTAPPAGYAAEASGQQGWICASEQQQMSSKDVETIKLKSEKEALAAEVGRLNKTLQRTKALYDEAFQAHLNRIMDLETQLQTKEGNAGQGGDLRTVVTLEGALQQQQRSQRDLEAYLAMQTEENNKLKAVLVQTQMEMESQQLQWQEKELELCQAHSHLHNSLMVKEAALQGAMDRLHNMEEQLVKMMAEKGSAMGQEEMQSWRDLEAYLTMQTEENYRLSSALVQAQMKIEHQQQWQVEMLRLHKSHGNLFNSLMEKEATLEHVMDRLHSLEGQLVNITAEKEELAAEVEQLNKMLHRTKALHDEASQTHHETIKDLESQLQSQEVNEVEVLQKVEMLEEALRQQLESQRDLKASLAAQAEENGKLKAAVVKGHAEIQNQRDLEKCLAMRAEENNKLKAAVVQAQAEIQTQRDLEKCLAMRTEENNKLKAAAEKHQTETKNQRDLEARLAIHAEENKRLRESMVQVQAENQNKRHLESRLAEQTEENGKLKTAMVQIQTEIQSRRNLEACLAVRTEEYNNLKAAVVRSQTEIQSQHDLEARLAALTQENDKLTEALFQAQAETEVQKSQREERELELCQAQSHFNSCLKEKEMALEGVMDRLHKMEEQLAKNEEKPKKHALQKFIQFFKLTQSN